MNTVPFFEVQLPREVALLIFSYLSMRELSTCARVGGVHLCQGRWGAPVPGRVGCTCAREGGPSAPVPGRVGCTCAREGGPSAPVPG